MWFRSAAAPPDAASRLCRGKEHGASGATAAADCGLPVGTAEICSATTARTTVGRRRWHLPGDRPQPYAVYVDDTDAVWVNDWGANAILSFDPKTDRRAPRRRAPRAAWAWLKQTDLIPDKGQLR